MANLTTVQSVVTRLGKGSVSDFQGTDTLDQIYSAITGATLRLSAILLTSFDQATLTDRYYVDPQEKPYSDQYPKLFLKQGFVDTSAAYSLKMAEVYSNLASSDDVNTDYLIRDDERGLLMVTGSDYYGNFNFPFTAESFYAQVAYTAGFTTKTDESFGRVYDGIPDWLKEAAISLAVYLYHLSDDCDEDQGACGNADILSLVEPHIRFYPSALKPLL
ncbi:MAG: hypothetical protein ACWGQW_01870 [bacterium]